MPMKNIHKRQFTFSSGYLLLALIVLWGLQVFVLREPQPKAVAYSEFLSLVDQGRVREATLREDEIVAVLKPESKTAEKPAAGQKPEGTNAQPAPSVPTAPAAPSAPSAKEGERITTSRLPRVDETGLLQKFRDKGVKFSGRVEKTSPWSALLL